MFVSSVMNNPDSTIGLVKAVETFDNVSIAGLMLGLHVVSVRILHLIFERVFRMSLQINTTLD